MKNYNVVNSFHKITPSFRRSVQRTIGKLSKITKFEVPISMTFREKGRGTVEVRLITRVNGHFLAGVGHGKNSYVALKNAQKEFFRGYEPLKKRYNQRALRKGKKMKKPLHFSMEEPLDSPDELAG